MRIAGLILAAGQSSRFGSDKRQVVLPDGRSMLDAVVAQYTEVFDVVWLVVGPLDAFATDVAKGHGAQCLVNEQAGLGMGHSLACGAKTLMTHMDVTGVVVGLADMPAIANETLLALRQALSMRSQAVVPVYRGQLGQPRGLPRSCFAALSQLTGDQGARQLLDWHQVEAIHVDDPGVLLDVDRPQDLAKLRS